MSAGNWPLETPGDLLFLLDLGLGNLQKDRLSVKRH